MASPGPSYEGDSQVLTRLPGPLPQDSTGKAEDWEELTRLCFT